MTTLFLLAHYDDEYGGWPLIETARRAGEALAFAHLAPPRDPAIRARRRGETKAFLRAMGLADAMLEEDEPASFDGGLIETLEAAYARLWAQAAGVDRIVTLAWEGGHVDHDLCAAMAVRLAADIGLQTPIVQFGLYNGERLAGPLFHGARPLAAGGPARRIELSARDWLRFAFAVRRFESQAPVWSTLWPAMFLSYLRGGYRYQTLASERVRERPHQGALLYERRRLGGYEEVAAAVSRLLDHAPSSTRGRRRR